MKMTAACVESQWLPVVKCFVTMPEYFTRYRAWTGDTEIILHYNVANSCRRVFTWDKTQESLSSSVFLALFLSLVLQRCVLFCLFCFVFFLIATTNEGAR